MALEGFSIRELQSEITKSDAEWQASETVFTEMSGEERAQFLGFVPAPGEPTLAEREQMAQAKLNELLLSTASNTYPTSYDLRNVSGRNFITPVVDQGACGSCVAFGVAATVEGRFRRQRNNPNLAIDFSEAHLFFCNNRQCKSGDPNYGWSSSAALNYFRDQGVVDEACYPYQGKNQACAPCSGAAGRLRKITGWKRITSHSEMKEWISTKGPLAASYTVYDDFFAYSGGIYKHVTGKVAGGHCVAVVGYDDSQKCWICKNSWGKTFGDENPFDPATPKEKGYFRIAYGQCGIDSSMDTVDAIAETGWERNQRIIGLWANNENRNAWAYVKDMGWRRVTADNDNIFFDIFNHLMAAKAINARVDFRQEESVIKEVYVF